MINPEEFKKLSLEYAEQIKYYNREIYKVKEQLRYLRTIRKTCLPYSITEPPTIKTVTVAPHLTNLFTFGFIHEKARENGSPLHGTDTRFSRLFPGELRSNRGTFVQDF